MYIYWIFEWSGRPDSRPPGFSRTPNLTIFAKAYFRRAKAKSAMGQTEEALKDVQDKLCALSTICEPLPCFCFTFASPQPWRCSLTLSAPSLWQMAIVINLFSNCNGLTWLSIWRYRPFHICYSQIVYCLIHFFLEGFGGLARSVVFVDKHFYASACTWLQSAHAIAFIMLSILNMDLQVPYKKNDCFPTWQWFVCAHMCSHQPQHLFAQPPNSYYN